MDRETFTYKQRLMDDVFESHRAAVVIAERRQGATMLMVSRIMLDMASIDMRSRNIDIYIVEKTLESAIFCLTACKNLLTKNGYKVSAEKMSEFSVTLQGGYTPTIRAVTSSNELWNQRGTKPGMRVYLDSASWLTDAVRRNITEAVISNDGSLLRGVSTVSNNEGKDGWREKLFECCKRLHDSAVDGVEMAFVYDCNLCYYPKKKKKLL